MDDSVINQVVGFCQGMTPADVAEAKELVPKYAVAQITAVLEYVGQHASHPNWRYFRQVLMAKRRRITYADYQTFDERSKAKIDRFVNCGNGRYRDVVLTGLEETPPAWLKPWAREAIYGDLETA